MKIEELYSIFNLSEYEKKVYFSFVQYSTLKPREVSQKSNVSYGRIYEILEKLDHKGLIFLSQSKPKEYSIIPIKESLENYINSKKNYLNKIEDDIKTLNFDKFKKEVKEEKTTIIKGKEQQQIIINNLHNTAKEEILGIPGKYHPPHNRKIATLKALHRGIKIKRIVQNIDSKNKSFLQECSQFGEEFKQYELEGLRLYVKDREEAILTIIDSSTDDRISIYTKNKQFSNSLAIFFESLWTN